jgi:hypothetical protein
MEFSLDIFSILFLIAFIAGLVDSIAGGVETLVTFNENEKLSSKNNNKFKQKINKSISFNTVKNHCFELFYSNKDIEIIFEEMSKLFLTNTIAIRPNRKFKRPSP